MEDSPRHDSVVDSLLHFNVIGAAEPLQYDPAADDNNSSLFGVKVKCEPSSSLERRGRQDDEDESVVESLLLQEQLQDGEEEKENEGGVGTIFNKQNNKEMVMIALHYDDKKDGAIPLPTR